MAICKLCQTREADKKNTHCLTDGIIRSALNIDGSNIRNRGFYFELGTETPFVEFGIQQDTPPLKVEEAIGRELTEAEILTGMQNPSAVDNCFCSDCEKHFADDIESKFMSAVLPKLRKKNFSKATGLELQNANLVRVFFYLQFWRSAVCQGYFSMPETTLERLRDVILNYPKVDEEEVKQFPLSVSYLGSSIDGYDFTRNLVGPTSSKNPYIIFMNDFIPQLYDDQGSIKYDSFHGLNDSDFQRYINQDEEKFLFRLLSEGQRTALLESVIDEGSSRAIDGMRSLFSELWYRVTGERPPLMITDACLTTIIFDQKAGPTQYSQETVSRKMTDFVAKNVPIWRAHQQMLSMPRAISGPRADLRGKPQISKSKRRRKPKPVRKSERRR